MLHDHSNHAFMAAYTFHVDVTNTSGGLIPSTIFNSIDSFTWISDWEKLAPAAVADLNITTRYPFLKYAELFTATGGCRAGFVDAHNKTCASYFAFDAPRLANGSYNWSRLLHAVDNVRAARLIPYIVTGNVPIQMSKDPTLGGFGVNTKLPNNLTEYSEYIQGFAAAALVRYGAAELREWKWGVLTEFNNRDWFDDGGPEGYFQLYDWTVCGLLAALSPANAMGDVGAHACSSCGNGAWDARKLITHVTTGTNYCSKAKGSQLDFLSNSFYAMKPETWSAANFHGVMQPLRDALDAAGLAHVPLGIGEGRIIAQADHTTLPSRAVGSTYQAAFDATLFKAMLDVRVSWYSRWAVNTNGQIGSSTPAIDSASTQTARVVLKMAGDQRVAGVQKIPPSVKICTGCTATPYHPSTCQCGCAGAKTSACCCPGGLPHPCIPCAGPGGGGSSDDVNVVVSRDETKDIVRLLVVHMSGDLAATESASAAITLCGLKPQPPQRGVKVWLIDDTHSTYWSEWEKDLAAHSATSSPWPAGESTQDETAPNIVRWKKGWEWVEESWPKYQTLAALHSTTMTIAISESGCAIIDATLAPQAVVLYEIESGDGEIALASPPPPPPFLGGAYPAFTAPSLPTRITRCDVTAAPWNAKGDGVTDDTAAIRSALATCGASSEIVLPASMTFLCGAINITSHTTLRVAGTLLASTRPSDFPIVPALAGYGRCRDSNYPESHAFMRHQGFIAAWNATDIAIVGGGTIDGSGHRKDSVLGTSWASRHSDKTLDYGRPRLYEPMYSSRLTLRNLTLTNQAFWAVHPYASDGVAISDVQIIAPRDEGIPNDDGFDADSTWNVLVERTFVTVGDNSVAIKSGMDKSGRAFGRASFNHVYRDSQFACETVAIGSEMSGGVFNITFDNVLFGGNGSVTDFAGIHLKSERGRGGAIRDIVFKNITFDLRNSKKQNMPFSANMAYDGGKAAPTNASATPVFERISVVDALVYLQDDDDADALGKKYSWEVIGLPESIVRNFTFTNIKLVSGADHGWHCVDTSGFQFNNVQPPPSSESGCLQGTVVNV